MKCLRCGYCCKNAMVMIVDDPAKGIVEDNIIAHMGEGIPCKHLEGEEAGKYSCRIHGEDWYSKTPCYSHGQIENGNTKCRMGNFILKEKKMNDR